MDVLVPDQRSNDGLLRVVVVILGVLVLFPVLMMLFAMPMVGMMGWYWDGGATGGLPPLLGLGLLVVWLAVLLGIGYLLYRGLVGAMGSSRTGDPALDELRLAYARGDLSEEEFEARRAKLESED